MSSKLLDGILLCPLSGEVLRQESGHLVSSRMKFPNVQGIPWLYRDPEGAVRQWQKKTADVIEYSRQQIDAAETALASPDILPSTRDRLARVQKGHEKNIGLTEGRMKPFLGGANSGEGFNLERVPKQQSAMAYQSTLFRDWAWGIDQVTHYADLVSPWLRGRKKVVYPGAGACGLPFKLHQQLKPELSLAVDINPFLLLPAKNLIEGQTVEAIEFPRFPRKSDQEYIEQHLKVAGDRPPGFEFLFADGQSLPVKDGAVDAVVTSWFIDIVSRDLRELARLFNAILEKGGVWINIGPLGFERNNLGQIYRPDEVREILNDSGFAVEEWSTPEVSYLKSPFDTVGRLDQVVVFSARKEKPAKRPAHYSYWPNWVASTSVPVPKDETIRVYQVKSAIYSFVLEQVDGKRSIQDIAAVLSAEFSMTSEEALRSVHAFFANFYEGVIFREF